MGLGGGGIWHQLPGFQNNGSRGKTGGLFVMGYEQDGATLLMKLLHQLQDSARVFRLLFKVLSMYLKGIIV